MSHLGRRVLVRVSWRMCGGQRTAWAGLRSLLYHVAPQDWWKCLYLLSRLTLVCFTSWVKGTVYHGERAQDGQRIADSFLSPQRSSCVFRDSQKVLLPTELAHWPVYLYWNDLHEETAAWCFMWFWLLLIIWFYNLILVILCLSSLLSRQPGIKNHTKHWSQHKENQLRPKFQHKVS